MLEKHFAVEINIPGAYGFVIIVICITWFLLNWLESRSFQARRRYEVPVSLEKLARINCPDVLDFNFKMASFQIQPDFGLVILVFIASVFLLQWLGFRVGAARKKYEIKYPKMYTEPYTHVFNCIQRAHQNTLEGYPIFLVLLIFGGLLYPKLSAGCGVLWIASRVVYAMGYYTGDPERRKYGAFGYLGLLILLIINITLALKLLGVVSV